MKRGMLNLAFTVLLLGCSVETELPGGYTLNRIDSANRAIVNGSGEIVVLPDVQSCRIIGEFVVGKRMRSEYPVVPEDMEHQQRDGLFILDVSDESLRTGVTQEEVDRLVANAVNDSDCMPFRLIGH